MSTLYEILDKHHLIVTEKLAQACIKDLESYITEALIDKRRNVLGKLESYKFIYKFNIVSQTESESMEVVPLSVIEKLMENK